MTRRKQGMKTWYLASFLFALLICQFSPTIALAQDESAGTFGASYLKIPVGPTLMSVPDVVAAMDPDASFAFSNPAVLARMPNGYAFFSRAAWLDELTLNAASIGLPIRTYDMAVSFGTRLLQAGELHGYDNNGQVVASESYYGLAMSGSLSKQFSSVGLCLGLGLTYLRERLPGETGSGMSMSIGASYLRGAHHIDMFAQDLGGKIAFEDRDYPLDSRYVVGYGYAFKQTWGRLDVGTQMVVSRSDVKRLQFGAAYHFPRFFVLRSGLNREFDAPASAQLPMSAGFGFRYGTFMLDYAFTPQEYFENTHTFSIGLSFGSGAALHQGPESRLADAAQAPPMAGAPAQRDKVGASSQKAAPLTTNSPTRKDTPSPQSPTPVSQDPGSDSPTTYLVVAGSHARAESARAEARALQLVKVPAVVETIGGRPTVVVGRYATRPEAEKALARYKTDGHVFEIRSEAP